MLACLLSACLLLTFQERDSQEDKANAAPSAEEVARVETSLEEAFGSRDLKRIQAALEASQAVPHPVVVRTVLRGLEDERPEVKLAAVQALRWIDHRDALEALHRAAKDRKLTRLPEVAAAILRGIGQHADPCSIEILAHDPFANDQACLRARIFGLARIRRLESIEALLGILAITGAGRTGERRIQPQMGDMRLGLMVLTGIDQGRSPELWERWWRENKKTFRIAPELPPLPKELRVTWDGFWGLPQVYERDRRREDRGQEPARPRTE